MSTYTVWQYAENDLTRLANQAKEQILFALASEDLLKGDPEEIAGQYVIVLHKRGFLGSVWDKCRGIKGDDLQFAVLKSVDRVRSVGEEPKAPVTYLKAVPPGEKED